MRYPLQLYVVWQPQKEADKDPCFEYAKAIFSTFNRNIEAPLDRGMGIPTYFISQVREELPIAWEAAEQTLVVWLIDNKMSGKDKARWQQAAQKVLDQAGAVFLPVFLSEFAINFYRPIEKINGIELYLETTSTATRTLLDQLIFKALKMLCESVEGAEEKQVTIFISYARKDGQAIANKVDRAIYNWQGNVNSFLDTKRIDKGKTFEEAINKKVQESILLVINTNLYNEREWCIKELLLAKEKQCPIVVVNAQYGMVPRTFPYLGNTGMVQLAVKPMEATKEAAAVTVDCIDVDGLQYIVRQVLLEGLRNIYQKKLLSKRLSTGFSVAPKAAVFSVPPELLTLAQHYQMKERCDMALYPDPPLGDIETRMLYSHYATKLVTPTIHPIIDLEQQHASTTEEEHQQETASALRYETLLEEFTIGISVSETTTVKDGLYSGTSRWHLQDALIELTRYLFVCGARCAYAGQIRYQVPELNFTTILFDLLEAYNNDYKHRGEEKRIINHVFSPYVQSTKNDYDLQEKYSAIIEFVYNESVEKKIDGQFLRPEDYTATDNGLALTFMRRSMFEAHNNAQIFIAGKIEGYIGIISGIVEEAYWALRCGHPIYLIGGFGGVAGALATLFETGESSALRREFEDQQSKEDWKNTYKAYQLEAHQLWGESPEQVDRRVRYASLKLFFLRHRAEQGDRYLNNGLSREDNETLFTSKNMLEINRLVLKGLYNYFHLGK